MHFFESFIKSHIESHTSTIYVDFKEMSLPTLLQIYLLSITPPRTATKILTLEMTIFGLKMMVKSGLEFFILKSYVPLQSCCCPVQKNRPRKAELAWQVSRYL